MTKVNRKKQSAKPLVTREISPGRPEFLREVNARQLLRLLRLHGPCSRADLSRQSGLSAPTVSSAISYLQGKGLVESVGPGHSTAGRRPSLLRFDSSRGYVVGADIGRSVVRVGLADLDGNLVDKWVAEVPGHNSPESVARQIIGAVRQLQRRHQIPLAKILAPRRRRSRYYRPEGRDRSLCADSISEVGIRASAQDFGKRQRHRLHRRK